MAAPAGLVLGAGAALGGIVYLVRRRRVSPAERERKRRQLVNARGRMTGGSVVDVRGDELFYSYTVRGAQYAAAQDLSGIRGRLPADFTALLGPATVKYDPANPANSILWCEEWSGLGECGTGSGGEGGPE